MLTFATPHHKISYVIENILAETPILFIEENRFDVALIKAAFKKAEIGHPLVHFFNGTDAIAYLNLDPPVPAFIILDINLQGKNGYELLRFIRTNVRLLNTKVLLFSAEERPDEAKMGKYRPDSYIIKPRNFDDYQIIVNSLCEQWLK